ncbi:MAG TPA: glycoside hydrolase family 5 protein, partial [Chitinophagales bacterium]|nr:glycoside hydrolase family 5 protein [Chitinophagales bacterium]
MQTKRLVVWAFFLLLLLGTTKTQGVLGQSVAYERAERLNKGQNLSNWLEAYWQTNYPNPTGYTRQHIAAMHTAGIRSLRLPVSFEYVTDEQPPYTVHTDNLLFALIDSAIIWAADFDMILLIDNHHGWEVTVSNYQQLVPRMAAMWKQMAQRYAYLDPNRYLFEIWNEPPLLIPEPYIRPFYQACLDSVRTVTNEHSIVIGAHAANLGLALAITTPYPDNNIIYTFHTYEPYNFTHQGFPWAEPFPFPTGTVFPLNNNDTLLVNTFTSVANWRQTHNVPVFLGEFGVGVYADAQSRCNWIGLVAALANQFNFPWIYWD